MDEDVPDRRGVFNEPDFNEIYGPDSGLTPRMAARLWEAADGLLANFDGWADDEDAGHDVLLRLPPVAQRFAESHKLFMVQFADRIGVVKQRLADGLDGQMLATCTADEVVVHLISMRAIMDFESDCGPYYVDELREEDGDENFDAASDLLQDEDVLMLYNPALDGIESMEWEEASFELPVNLHPRDWFEPF